MPDIQGQLVLAQNQHAFIQDATKGTVQVFAGPHALALSGNDRPVVYNREKDEFIKVDITEAIKQNPLVPEGHYLILENPVMDRDNKMKLEFPKQGSNSPVALEVGRKINIPGPTTFPLWPGQVAQTVSGHHLRSNQYLVVRVYNAEHAKANRPEFLKTEKNPTPGQQVVIKGTEVSFFIPPTGFEVLKDDVVSAYVREALTLERLEYCILLDEDGNKRFERGPKVVFPEATERFLNKTDDDKDGKRQSSRKFKAIELNDQMGLYIKIIADYDTEGTVKAPTGTALGGEFVYKGAKYRFEGPVQPPVAQPNNVPTQPAGGVVIAITGEELFITGKEQRIYYPRTEHALIEYDDPNQKSFKRQRYYGITIPKGEGRYVLDKEKGDIQKEEGPKIFLPDPRNQVIVRRVLDDKTVSLWYPGNPEALAFNQQLRILTEDATGYLAETVVASAAADITRSMNRGTERSKLLGAAASFEGDTLRRGTKFTPPPMLTLNTKYDGVPSINVWTGWAVQVVNRAGERRVVIGPATILLEYDESLEMLELSTGKPKSTDRLIRDTYLRVDNNLVSDIVHVETKDLVGINLKLSYRVNFLREHSAKWFTVENYVKFMCDHMRSLLKGALKKQSVKEIMENSAATIRDTVLGMKKEGEVRKHFFPENGMEVYDVEVLGVEIADPKISSLLKEAQTKAVESAITLSAKEQNLENTRRQTTIQMEMDDLEARVLLHKEELDQNVGEAEFQTSLANLKSEIEKQVVQANADVVAQEQKTSVAQSELERRKAIEDQDLVVAAKNTEFFVTRTAAISPSLIEAITLSAKTDYATKLATAIAPLAISEQSGLDAMLDRVFKGTPIQDILENLRHKAKTAGQ
jgi:major vault protein